MCTDTGLSLSIQDLVKGSLTRGRGGSRRAVTSGCLIIYFDLSRPRAGRPTPT